MATYWENSCSFGLRYVKWYKYLIVGLVFSHLGFWSGNLFLIAPFPDLCLLVPFYSANSSFCKHCSINCDASHGCDKNTGICLACNDKWSGDQCEVPCPTSCMICNQNNHKQCKVCSGNKYGLSCENHCSDACVHIENMTICDKDSGRCLLGCLAGYWGDTCSSKCGQGCSGTVCDQTNGDCLGNCEQIYYGHACDKMCSTTCSEIAFHNRTCHNISGECLGGCKSGYYGAECTEICSTNCNRSLCFKENGTCTHGCVGNIRGPACTKGKRRIVIPKYLYAVHFELPLHIKRLVNFG